MSHFCVKFQPKLKFEAKINFKKVSRFHDHDIIIENILVFFCLAQKLLNNSYLLFRPVIEVFVPQLFFFFTDFLPV